MTHVHERRHAPRRRPHASDLLARLRLRTGRDVAVVNLAAGGALVEADSRLLPGTHIDVHVASPAGRAIVRSRVVRAYVWRVSSDRIVYRGGLAFERPIDVDAGYPFPSPGSSGSMTGGKPYPAECA